MAQVTPRTQVENVAPRGVEAILLTCDGHIDRWNPADLTRIPVSAIFNHMVNSRSQQLDETFFALSDPTRRQILARLAGGDMTVAELSEPFDVSAPAVSKHLRVLERAGLLTREREGRVRRCHLVPEPLKDAAAWVQKYRRFWEAQLDQLAEYFEHSAADPERGE